MWTKDEYSSMKEEIRHQYRRYFPVESIKDLKDQKAVIRQRELDLFDSITALVDSRATKDTQLNLYIKCLFILSHWRRWGGKTESRYNRVMTAINYALSWYGKGSALSTMTRDFQSIVTAMHFRFGEYQKAIVEEYSYNHKTSRSNRALCSLNDGCLPLSLDLLGDDQSDTANLIRLKVARLSGNLDDFDRLYPLCKMTNPEVKWEKMFRDIFTHSEQARGIFEIVDKEEPYMSDATYVLEAYLLWTAIGSPMWAKIFSRKTLEYLIKARNIAYQAAYRPFWQYCKFVDSVKKDKIKRHEIVQGIGKFLEESFPLDKRLLFYLSAERLCADNRIKDFSRVFRAKYEKECLGVSEGASRDIIGIVMLTDKKKTSRN